MSDEIAAVSVEMVITFQSGRRMAYSFPDLRPDPTIEPESPLEPHVEIKTERVEWEVPSIRHPHLARPEADQAWDRVDLKLARFRAAPGPQGFAYSVTDSGE